MVARDDGAVTVVASTTPAAVVRNSSALRAWRDLARPVWGMLVEGDRATAERLAADASGAMPAVDGRWRCEPARGAAALIAEMAAARGVRLLTAAERECEAERIVDEQIDRVMAD